ncbi:hypothetical protein [Bacillus sp. 3255]|uniref:hypothetical protein n=1 Tax=Bacillus sp. 3255 TaxID=2817904 RepID=UPI00286D0B99|nr:hypothetical protein [Bacillus sp. 3255]
MTGPSSMKPIPNCASAWCAVPCGSSAPDKPTGHETRTPASSSCSSVRSSTWPIVRITKVPPGKRLRPPIACKVKFLASLAGIRNSKGLNIE